MPLRSRRLTLAGSRVCALALLRTSRVSVRLSARGHLQPLVHRARVPWPYLALTGVTVATSPLALAYLLGSKGSPALTAARHGREVKRRAEPVLKTQRHEQAWAAIAHAKEGAERKPSERSDSGLSQTARPKPYD